MNESICANCDAVLEGEYCAACGQRRFRPRDRRMAHLLGESFDALTDFDGRIWRSLRAALLQPGRIGTSGAARQFPAPAVSIAAASSRSASSLARLMPMELPRSWCWLRYRSTGSGMRGCGMCSSEETNSTGSRTSSSTGIVSSVMRLTKLEFAPFSSSRRTRYGSRSSCEPTGA